MAFQRDSQNCNVVVLTETPLSIWGGVTAAGCLLHGQPPVVLRCGTFLATALVTYSVLRSDDALIIS